MEFVESGYKDGSALRSVRPDLERIFKHCALSPAPFDPSDISIEQRFVSARDGTQLATDIYLPPIPAAPTVVVRTPYGRNRDERGFVGALIALARRGYAVVAQDCRGTGGSEPEEWDYYIFEPEDGYDLVEWIAQQPWFDGFIGSLGGSYSGQVQWCMATHPAMSTIVPHCSGLGFGIRTAHTYMFVNAYARVMGKGSEKANIHFTEMEEHFAQETSAGGYFNEPIAPQLPSNVIALFPGIGGLPPAQARQRLWEEYCSRTCPDRAQLLKSLLGVAHIDMVDVESLSKVFGHRISHDRHTLPHIEPGELCRLITAPPLLRTGWYDWGLNDALETYAVFRREAASEIASKARLIITPYAHNTAGYREGSEASPELHRVPQMIDYVPYLMKWYESVRKKQTETWPNVIYYLMGANEWRVASDWPVPAAVETAIFLGPSANLLWDAPDIPSPPDTYIYDPRDPTPTVGGSIVSFMYTPGSVDVSRVQERRDVLAYTSAPLDTELDIVGPLRMVLYASSSAQDTDFVVRLSDVAPDGRAIQLQNGILRARYRDIDGDPAPLEPGKIYRLEIDMWATANRFKAGHCIRVDVSSADFPRYDRNSNLGGNSGDPVSATQMVYHDPKHPSHLVLSVLAEKTEPM